ncbi:unnamed protein product, partial [Porites evermanni]
TVFVFLFAEEVYSLRLIYEGAKSNDSRCNYDGRYVRINLKECCENKNSRNECPAFAVGETSKNSNTNFTLEKSEKDEKKRCISFNKTYSLAFKGNSTSFENVSCQDEVDNVNVWFNYEIYNHTGAYKRYRAFYYKQVWKNWCVDKDVTDEIENYEPAELLEHFYAEVNNKKGEDYEPESLKVMTALLDRHLKNKGCTLSIVRVREFSSSKEVLEDKAK